MGDNYNIIEDMKKLGLSEYEVKAYLKLLEENPVNGYVLSKNSGIPRSRIYEVLDSLKNKQIVFEKKEGQSTLYIPLEPKLLISKMKNDYEDILKNVDDFTNKVLSKEDESNEFFVVKGRTKIVDLINTLIRESNHSIKLSVWEEELEDFQKEIDSAIKRGVMIQGVYFGGHNKYDGLVTHRRAERYLSEKHNRYIIVIVDNAYVLSGIIARGDDSQVSLSKDKALVGLSDHLIIHDVMVNRYASHLEETERQSFEDYLDLVRKDYYGFSDEEFEKLKK